MPPKMSVAKAECWVTEQQVFTFVLGLSIGFMANYIYFLKTSKDSTSQFVSLPVNNNQLEVEADIHDHSSHNSSVAAQLYKSVRVLCWVMTQPKNHKFQAAFVKATWGRRCNVLLFMSSEKDSSLPTVELPVGEGRDHLWAKTKEAFRYVYEHHRRDADWFLKADDDTYIIVENLRQMLAMYDPRAPLYFGCRFKQYVKQGFMSGGAGYVISKEALTRFVQVGLSSPKLCSMDHHGNEDLELGWCLQNIGVKAMDTRDKFGRGRFFPFMPEHHIFPNPDPKFWLHWYSYYKVDKGLNCCSDLAISFHYVTPKDMFVMEYLIYHLRPFGTIYGQKDLVPKRLGKH